MSLVFTKQFWDFVIFKKGSKSVLNFTPWRQKAKYSKQSEPQKGHESKKETQNKTERTEEHLRRDDPPQVKLRCYSSRQSLHRKTENWLKVYETNNMTIPTGAGTGRSVESL